jgi:class 3 adenylate cyclase
MSRPLAKDAGVSAERRIITALAVDTVGSTRHIANCDPDEAQAFLDRCFEHLTQAIERSGGVLVNFGGDGWVDSGSQVQACRLLAEARGGRR